MILTHYVIVRRDLPIGILAAMVCHAAGESGAMYEHLHNERFRGATAVVLEVANENGLLKVIRRLNKHQILHIVVRESDPPYDGQWMAIGLVPVEREKVEHILREYQLLKPAYEPPLRDAQVDQEEVV